MQAELNSTPSQYFNIYCDESRFSNPLAQYFLIGSLQIPREHKPELAKELKRIRRQFGFAPELKWQNVTSAKLPYLNELVDLFFESSMQFRTIVVDKSKLTRRRDGQVAETPFYKFYYLLLRGAFQENSGYYIFLDQRTKTESRRITHLYNYLEASLLKLNGEIPRRSQVEKHPYLRQIQEVNSSESIFLQLADLFMGAVGYQWNGLKGSSAKLKLIQTIEKKLGKDNLLFPSQLHDRKWNQFIWRPKAESAQ